MQRLMWQSTVIGIINPDYSVDFTENVSKMPRTFHVLKNQKWTRQDFERFLVDRIPSRNRRDIEMLLARMHLYEYDIFDIAEKTHAVNVRDLFWLGNQGDTFNNCFQKLSKHLFLDTSDYQKRIYMTPEGQNVKDYGVYHGSYGIIKKRLSPLLTDVESEVAVYRLFREWGIPCCHAVQIDKDKVFSQFSYRFGIEYLVHFRTLLAMTQIPKGYSLLNQIMAVRPEFFASYVQMLVGDFLTRQEDRHTSNFAIVAYNGKEHFYPLYDNGRSLFYESTIQDIEDAVGDIEKYSAFFGQSDTYYKAIIEIAKERPDVLSRVITGIKLDRIGEILDNSFISGYRKNGVVEWMRKGLIFLNSLI